MGNESNKASLGTKECLLVLKFLSDKGIVEEEERGCEEHDAYHTDRNHNGIAGVVGLNEFNDAQKTSSNASSQNVSKRHLDEWTPCGHKIIQTAS